MTTPGLRLTVVVHLPQPVDVVVGLLNAIAANFPEARIDITGQTVDGWLIELPAPPLPLFPAADLVEADIVDDDEP